MNRTITKLAAFGHFIEVTRRQMHISKELLCADIQCSKSTYCAL